MPLLAPRFGVSLNPAAIRTFGGSPVIMDTHSLRNHAVVTGSSTISSLIWGRHPFTDQHTQQANQGHHRWRT